MHNTVKNLLDIENNIKTYLNKIKINNIPKIVAVSKTFKIDKILKSNDIFYEILKVVFIGCCR